jgi:hypothetical protein
MGRAVLLTGNGGERRPVSVYLGLAFLDDGDIMVTFVSTLLIGAVAGWVFEQKHGSELLRWSRQKRMQMRALRRKGASPLDAWKSEE